jgi:glycerophosphoryl diester phosphodiesterase
MHTIAHRGISAHYPENTLLAYQKALESKAIGIEVDVHEVDDHFILYHDFTLDKLTGIRADLVDLSFNKLRDIRFAHDQMIPTLDELFSVVQGKCMLNLELKAIASPEKLLEQIVSYVYRYNADIVISSFNHPLVLNMQHLVRNTRIRDHVKFAALIGHLPIDLAKYALDLQVEVAAIDAMLVTPEFVEHAHQYNIDVWSYTINHTHDYARLKAMGVDAVFSNDPDFLENSTTG